MVHNKDVTDKTINEVLSVGVFRSMYSKSIFKNFLCSDASKRYLFIIPSFFRSEKNTQPGQNLSDCPWPELLYRRLLLMVGVVAVVVLFMRVF